jgi:DNA-binding NarL/FixJ family response regulator
MSWTLFLADDHPIVRQGLKALLRTESDFELVGESADGLDTIRQVERLKPDVLVLDLALPSLNGLEVTREVHRRLPRTRVIILSMYADEGYVLETMQAGASAYVVKESGLEELLQALREVVAGRRYLSPPLSESALEAYTARAEGGSLDRYRTLTRRERQVLHLTAEGQSSEQVAKRLFISPRTVESHRTNLMHKLGVHNQRELIQYVLKRGILLRPPDGPFVADGE